MGTDSRYSPSAFEVAEAVLARPDSFPDTEIVGRLARGVLSSAKIIDGLLAALLEWKCTSCGGTGVYHQNARDTSKKAARGVSLDPQYNPAPVPCKVCAGRKLHPKAWAAIQHAHEKDFGTKEST